MDRDLTTILIKQPNRKSDEYVKVLMSWKYKDFFGTINNPKSEINTEFFFFIVIS